MSVTYEVLLTAEQLEERWPEVFKVSTLKSWRYTGEGRGPRWAPYGRKILYRESDVIAWLDAQYAAAQGGAA